mgnify:FL=1
MLCSKVLFPRSLLCRFFTNKIFSSVEEAVADIKSGASVMVGGFGVCGSPENLLPALAKRCDEVEDLNTIVLSCGNDYDLANLLKTGMVKRLTTSFVALSPTINKMYSEGDLELELIPQGTIAEKVRAAGAGIPAFYTPAGAGTIYQEGGFPISFEKDGAIKLFTTPKPTGVFKHHSYVQETALSADWSLISAKRADTIGNIQFHGSAQNLNIDAGKAAKHTIVEVEEIVPVGELDPDHIHLPGLYVERIVCPEHFNKPIEFMTVDTGKEAQHLPPNRERIARRQRSN